MFCHVLSINWARELYLVSCTSTKVCASGTNNHGREALVRPNRACKPQVAIHGKANLAKAAPGETHKHQANPRLTVLSCACCIDMVRMSSQSWDSFHLLKVEDSASISHENMPFTRLKTNMDVKAAGL